MSQAPWQSKTPYQLLINLALITLGSASILSLIAAIIIIPVFGINIFTNPEVLSNYSNPAVISSLKVIQILNATGMFIIPSAIMAYAVSPKPFTFLSLEKAPDLRTSVLTILLVITALPMINFLAEWNEGMKLPDALKAVEQWMRESEANLAKATQAFLKMAGIGDLLLNLFMIAFLAALGEELLFRGIVQKLFTQLTRNPHTGIWIAALLFSALHMQFYGFVPRMLLGAMFGYLYLWTGSLWVPILGHFANNGFAVTASYLIQKGVLSAEVDTIGAEPQSFFPVLVSLASVITCFTLIWYYKAKERANQL